MGVCSRNIHRSTVPRSERTALLLRCRQGLQVGSVVLGAVLHASAGPCAAEARPNDDRSHDEKIETPLACSSRPLYSKLSLTHSLSLLSGKHPRTNGSRASQATVCPALSATSFSEKNQTNHPTPRVPPSGTDERRSSERLDDCSPSKNSCLGATEVAFPLQTAETAEPSAKPNETLVATAPGFDRSRGGPSKNRSRGP